MPASQAESLTFDAFCDAETGAGLGAEQRDERMVFGAAQHRVHVLLQRVPHQRTRRVDPDRVFVDVWQVSVYLGSPR